MAIGSSTSTPVPASKALYAKSTGEGNAVSFLSSTDKSPVQQMLAGQKKAQADKPGSYFESEDWLRMKAFAIRARIVMYQNLGLTQEYQSAQQEGAEVVNKYQALLKKQQAEAGAKALQDQINAKLGLDV